MKLYNSLTKTKDNFNPINPNKIGIYTCGPTVYSYVTIGNWRTYVLGDLVFRTIKYLYPEAQVNYVMNITDVGHLTGDNLGDADTGEDRLEKAAQKEGKTAWDIADFYAQDFVKGFELLNLTWPTKPIPEVGADNTNHFCKATEHIDEQIQMVKEIEQKGFAYKISDGIYFDTQAFEAAGHEYGQLSNIDQVKEGARVEPNPEKKDPRDFALWKYSVSDPTSSLSAGLRGASKIHATSDKKKTYDFPDRQMNWWFEGGLSGQVINKKDWETIELSQPELLKTAGFPGWHIECSAMSTKYLGDQFDIHLGGEDLKSTHHPNEIAQAEAVTGKQFVKYWIHGAFLQVDGGRMGKSLGNAYTLTDIIERGFDPLALRYFYFSSHYRKPLNFTWEALKSSAKAISKLKGHIKDLTEKPNDLRFKIQDLRESNGVMMNYIEEFHSAIDDDLNMPQALAVLWEVVGTKDISDQDKIELLEKFDQVLGLDLLQSVNKQTEPIPDEITELVDQREQYRANKDFAKADEIRDKIRDLGYEILDTDEGVVVRKL